MTLVSRKLIIGLVLMALVVPVLTVSSASAERSNNNYQQHSNYNNQTKCSNDEDEELSRIEDRGFSLNYFNNQDSHNEGRHHYNKPTCVTATPATAEDPTCDQLGFYIIPTTVGVNYTVDGQVVAAGNHTVPNGTTVTIVAVAQQGYAFNANTPTSWTYTITAPTNCTTATTVSTTPTPTPAPQVQVVPTGGVYAGGGGAQNSSAAVFGLISSMTIAAVGLVRKFVA